MRNPIQDYLESLADHGHYAVGKVASYIPELAAADPDRFALCIATVDGHLYTVGDGQFPYSIQSISKPFTYALALQDRGPAAVAQKIDVEPSGDAFNEISLDPGTKRPSNPMINAGAITAASLVAGKDRQERFDRVQQWFSDFAGSPLTFDQQMYESELGAAHRNRAIAHMLREFEVLESDPEDFLDQYIRQCAMTVTTQDLARMAATLANGGVQPATGERVAEPNVVEHVLSVMTSCGMYDTAGDWITSVGVPAKSGVSGGIIGVLPGQLGLAVFSPRLDAHGHSARGVAVFEHISEQMELHLMQVTRSSRTAVRDTYSLAERPSRRRRPEPHQILLDTLGEQCRIYELQGDLNFSGVESVVRQMVEDSPEFAVLDMRRVNDVAEVARMTLLSVGDRIRAAGGEAVLVDPEDALPIRDDEPNGIRIMDDLEAAMRWCEDELLRRHGADEEVDHQQVEEHPLLQQMSAAARRYMRTHFDVLHFAADEVILEAGEPFSGIHIVTAGEAVAEFDYAHTDGSTPVTMSVGTSFGELALARDDLQEARVRAATPVTLLKFSAEALDHVSQVRPSIAVDIWKAMTRDAYRVADRAMHEAAAYW
ncbi:MAG: glutaminase A [Nesterenkonia sp.]